MDDADKDVRCPRQVSRIGAVCGFDMTGFGHDRSGYLGTRNHLECAKLLHSLLHCGIRLRRPVYTGHQAPRVATISHWYRLILPLGLDGQINWFLVGNLPISNGEVP